LIPAAASQIAVTTLGNGPADTSLLASFTVPGMLRPGTYPGNKSRSALVRTVITAPPRRG
jgi:hypothetical protein